MTNKFPAIRIITGSIADKQFYPKHSLISWLANRIVKINGARLVTTEAKDGFYAPFPTNSARNKVMEELKANFPHTGYQLNYGCLGVKDNKMVFEKYSEEEAGRLGSLEQET